MSLDRYSNGGHAGSSQTRGSVNFSLFLLPSINYVCQHLDSGAEQLACDSVKGHLLKIFTTQCRKCSGVMAALEPLPQQYEACVSLSIPPLGWPYTSTLPPFGPRADIRGTLGQLRPVYSIPRDRRGAEEDLALKGSDYVRSWPYTLVELKKSKASIG